METPDAAPVYHIWAIDKSAYGPVELPTLVNWIRDERVLGETWLFVERENGWLRAAEVPELSMFFRAKRNPETGSAASSTQIQPGALRRIKALAEMSDEQLSSLLTFIEVVQVRPFTHLVRKGEPGEALYGVLEGEVRSCFLVDGKESPLATLGPGGVFGEISLFDKGPHAVDVISNEESVLVVISASALARMIKDAPDTAFALLLGLIKAIAGRVRNLTKRYEDSVSIARRTEPLQVG